MTWDKLQGFCNGFFGRDSYGDKSIEGEGNDWIVAREIDSQKIVIATFLNDNEKNCYLRTWRNTEGMGD